ncbi:uncharacterized protein LOC135165624 [Diachasmimorpha longicaudata]|uniref:uncharacterized protein LOC135165624 n=1 Tax=Diachasmimorpha longicaudata TaxID=58733 RepID=UPI0030B8BCBE
MGPKGSTMLLVAVIVLSNMSSIIIADSTFATSQSSVLYFGKQIWNILSSTANRTAPLWRKCTIPEKLSSMLFRRSMSVLFLETDVMDAVELHAIARLRGLLLSDFTDKINAIPVMITNFMVLVQNVNDAFTSLKSVLSQKQFSVANICSWTGTVIAQQKVTESILQIHDFLHPSFQGDRFLNEFLQHLKNSPNDGSQCRGFSPHDYLYALYDMIMVTKMKGYVVETILFRLLNPLDGQLACKYARKNLVSQVTVLYDRLRQHTKNYNTLFVRKLSKTSRNFQACPGEAFVRDVTHIELEGAIQGFLQNRFFQAKGEKYPHLECSEMSQTKTTPSYCLSKSNTCSTPIKRPCLGKLIDCEEIPNIVTACIAEHGPERYKWVEEGFTYPVDICPSELKHKLDHPCLCKCVDNDIESPSTHIFNLQPVEADVADNMVVTGVKFIVKNQVIQFQIEQGRLGSNWIIEGRPKWKPINDISEKIRAHRLKNLRRKSSHVNNTDYLIVNENLQIYFDEVAVPQGHVLTGVKFNYIEEESAIQIAILSKPFDVASGNLSNVEKEYIKAAPYKQKQKWMLPTDDEEAYGDDLDDIIPNIDEWFLIGPSRDDPWGQTTLPYFQGTPLVSSPPSALGGFGIFNRHQDTTIGTVALKFLSIDYGFFMNKDAKSLSRPGSRKRKAT